MLQMSSAKNHALAFCEIPGFVGGFASQKKTLPRSAMAAMIENANL